LRIAQLALAARPGAEGQGVSCRQCPAGDAARCLDSRVPEEPRPGGDRIPRSRDADPTGHRPRYHRHLARLENEEHRGRHLRRHRPLSATRTRRRCAWAGEDPLMVRYHDREWGRPQHDDRVLYEFLVLEGAQAGLSWQTILRKRENYRKAFAGFDPVRVARFDAARRRRLLADPGIVRNRAKVASAVENARL